MIRRYYKADTALTSKDPDKGVVTRQTIVNKLFIFGIRLFKRERLSINTFPEDEKDKGMGF